MYHPGVLHQLLGSEAFWLVMKSGAIRLVNPPNDPAVIFLDEDALVGESLRRTAHPDRSPPEPFPSRSEHRSNLIRKGLICAQIRACATQMTSGSEQLATAA